MKIGIPRSLYYYYYKDFWINFFDYLKIDIIISPKSNNEIFDLGIKYSQDEMCLSLKNYIGHVAYLKDKCDYILIPRIDNYGLDNQTCTNFLASYDIINNLLDVKILNYNINLRGKETELKAFINLGKKLNISKKKICEAYIYAKTIELKNKRQLQLENLKKLSSAKVKILFLSHPYNTYDELIGKPIIEMLKKLNIEIIYSDLFDNKNYKDYSNGLYWKYIKNNISSISDCIDSIDGIIFLESFPCGLDSLANELVMRKLKKPYINIVIDDICSMGGIETRIESFVDVISNTYSIN